MPTPERPVYFRQTYGNYPGTTPPLEWWDGTPTTKKVKVGDSKSSREAEVVDFADQKSKNILWKVPVPGWSLSHPIVVGKRVFAVGEPDFVTCWDLDTGKQLWQRRIMPLQCDGLPEEKAAAGQKVLDLARALWLVTGAPPGGSTQYTRPFDFEGRCVPEILLSGHHAAISLGRRKEALKRTAVRRPDLLAKANLTRKDEELLEEIRHGGDRV